MKLITWNVNGIKSMFTKHKDHLDYLFETHDPDIFCINETKVSNRQDKTIMNIEEEYPQYKYKIWNNSQEKLGYSGVSIWCKRKPKNIFYGLNMASSINESDEKEGRIITVEYMGYFVVCVYTPNSGAQLKRLDYRVNEWDKRFVQFVKNIQQNYSKKIIITGDLNVAHHPIDIANPTSNKKNAGFTEQERKSFTNILEQCSLVDTFRYKYPTIKDIYSFWSYRNQSRSKNIGWRVDYVLTTNTIVKKMKDVFILTDIMGSDHAPVFFEI